MGNEGFFFAVFSGAIHLVTWRRIADWGRRSPRALALADWLGRGQGGYRFLDHLFSRASASVHRPAFANWEKLQLSAAWIGHATVLLRIGGKTILTDPVMGSHVGLGLGLATGGPSRLIAPALRLSELPKLDLILISHAHYDHLDRPTLARLPKNVPVITSARTRDLIDDLGFTDVKELNWGDSTRIDNLVVRAWEVRHWGARTQLDHHRTACSFLLEADGKRVLFGGDTAFGRQFASAGKVDLAVLGIGAYDPWEAGHATPEQAWLMADEMGADFVLPMHHSTFRLSHEPMAEPIARLFGAAGRGWDRVIASEVGQSWSLN